MLVIVSQMQVMPKIQIYSWIMSIILCLKIAESKLLLDMIKENLTKAILFIASILPRKFDQSATHELVKFSKEFVLDQLAIIDALFTEDDKSVNTFTQVWNARKDVPQKMGR